MISCGFYFDVAIIIDTLPPPAAADAAIIDTRLRYARRYIDAAAMLYATLLRYYAILFHTLPPLMLAMPMLMPPLRCFSILFADTRFAGEQRYSLYAIYVFRYYALLLLLMLIRCHTPCCFAALPPFAITPRRALTWLRLLPPLLLSLAAISRADMPCHLPLRAR